MSKNFEVIKAFHMPLEAETLQEIEKIHSYISDKLILDAVNGVNVVARDLHEVSKSRKSFCPRIIDGIFGNSRKRQDLITEDLIEGLNSCTNWLRDYNRHFSRIDNKISIVANELSRTQDEILKFYLQHKELKSDVGELKEIIIKFKQSANQRSDDLDYRIKKLETRTEAMYLIDSEFSRLNNNIYDYLAVPLRIYTVLDNIKSGEGGIYYDTETDEKKKKDFKDLVANKLMAHFKTKCHLKEYIDYEQVSKDVFTLAPIKKESLAFISTQHYNAMLEKDYYPEVADLVSIVTSYEKDVAMQEIDKQSNIRTFFTYGDYIETALDEHLTA